jgi:single-strand DNA-binding protein
MYCRVIVVGHLGRDPEMRYTPSGQPVTSFSVATSRAWSDRESGDKREETTWFRISVWGKQAEFCNEYLRKGRLVLVEGDRIQASAYKNRETGEPAASLELTARTVRFLSSSRDQGSGEMGMGEMPDDVDSIPF